jgi:hypothetical protein
MSSIVARKREKEALKRKAARVESNAAMKVTGWTWTREKEEFAMEAINRLSADKNRSASKL